VSSYVEDPGESSEVRQKEPPRRNLIPYLEELIKIWRAGRRGRSIYSSHSSCALLILREWLLFSVANPPVRRSTVCWTLETRFFFQA
jgi:hypothetical protein